MKINLTSSAPDAIVTPQSNQTDATSADRIQADQVQSAPGDRTTLAFDHAKIGALTDQAMASPEVRQDKVAALRQAINSGEYRVDPGQVAEAMLPESPEV